MTYTTSADTVQNAYLVILADEGNGIAAKAIAEAIGKSWYSARCAVSILKRAGYVSVIRNSSNEWLACTRGRAEFIRRLVRRPKPERKPPKLGDLAARVLAFIQQERGAKALRICAALGLRSPQVCEALRRLAARGLIVRCGPARSPFAVWIPASDAARAAVVGAEVEEARTAARRAEAAARAQRAKIRAKRKGLQDDEDGEDYAPIVQRLVPARNATPITQVVPRFNPAARSVFDYAAAA